MVSTQPRGANSSGHPTSTPDQALPPLLGGGGLAGEVTYGVVRSLATVQPVLIPGVGELSGAGAEGSRVWLPWVSGCLPGSVCSLAHLVLFILISCRHTAMSDHLINRVASIHGALVHALGNLVLVLDKVPSHSGGASVRSPGPSYCPCSSESPRASAATATRRVQGCFSHQRGVRAVWSAGWNSVQDMPGPFLKAPTSFYCGCCLSVSTKADSRVNNALCMLLRDS